MKIAVFGAGAIGSYLGWKLSQTNHTVTLIARGAHLAAMQEKGLALRAAGPDEVIKVNAVPSGAPLPPQDLVLLCVKAHTLPSVTAQVTPLLHGSTMVMPVVNGIPWWYAYGAPVPMEPPYLQSVDPGGAVWKAIGPERAIGCVPYVGVSVPEPGVVALSVDGYNEFPVGEPNGEESARIRAVAELFKEAGITTAITPTIRALIWKKLLGNVTTNPISVITGATMEQMLTYSPTTALTRAIMEETLAVAKAAGVDVTVDLEERIHTLSKLGDFKTSTLQDYEAGRPLEIAPITGAVLEMAELLGVATPHLATVYQLVSAIADRHAERIGKAA